MPRKPKSYWDVGDRQRRRRLQNLAQGQRFVTATLVRDRSPLRPSNTEAHSAAGEEFPDSFEDSGHIHSTASSPVMPVDDQSTEKETPLTAHDTSVDESVDFRAFDDCDDEDVHKHGRAYWNFDDDEDSFAEYENVFLTEEFCGKLRNICVAGTISKPTLDGILTLLKTEVPGLSKIPKTARRLLETPVKTGTHLDEMKPGQYYHFGIEDYLRDLFKNRKPPKVIKLAINIDGLPLFKSPRSEFWPILASIVNVPELSKNVFVIGLYYGPGKPNDFDQLVKKFVDDCNKLYTEGMSLNGRNIRVRVKILSFDAPAKAYVLGIVHHNGLSGCTQCKIEGFSVNHRTYFPGVKFVVRTHAEFIAMVDEDFNKRRSYIMKLKGVDLIKSVALDYLHLVCLGVVKKLLGFWIECPQKSKRYKLDADKLNAISAGLSDITKTHCNPSDLGRPPRGFEQLSNFKGVEYRTFLLKTGPVVLKGNVDKAVYDNFMLLHCAITILASPRYCYGENIDKAERLLIRFVETFTLLYGKVFISHNVHNLLHLPEHCRRFGPLDLFSVFKYENKLQEVKRYIGKKGSQPLEQAVNRIHESRILDPIIDVVNDSKSFSALHPWKGIDLPPEISSEIEGYSQYRTLDCAKFKLKCGPHLADACCGLEDGTVVIVECILVNEDKSSVLICGRALTGQENIYSKPFKSKHLESYMFSGRSDLKIWRAEEILCKYFIIAKESYYAFPFHHSYLP